MSHTKREYDKVNWAFHNNNQPLPLSFSCVRPTPDNKTDSKAHLSVHAVCQWWAEILFFWNSIHTWVIRNNDRIMLPLHWEFAFAICLPMQAFIFVCLCACPLFCLVVCANSKCERKRPGLGWALPIQNQTFCIGIPNNLSSESLTYFTKNWYITKFLCEIRGILDKSFEESEKWD